MLSGEADESDAIVEINSGAGGTDASDWAEMLKRMYLQWASSMGFKAKLVDETPAEEAGIKSCTIEIAGQYAYGTFAQRLACTDWYASLPSTPMRVATRRLPPWRPILRWTTTLRSTSSSRISASTPIGHQARADSTSTPPIPPFASRTCRPTLWSSVRTSGVSTRTRRRP